MIDHTACQMDGARISQQKMQFHVIHHRPKYSCAQSQTARAEIERQLFAVFYPYAYPDGDRTRKPKPIDDGAVMASGDV